MMIRRIATIWKILNAPCREMTLLLSREQDDPLPALEVFALRLHLLYCSACRRYKRNIGVMRRAVRRAADALDASSTPALSPESRRRIKQAMDDSSDLQG